MGGPECTCRDLTAGVQQTSQFKAGESFRGYRELHEDIVDSRFHHGDAGPLVQARPSGFTVRRDAAAAQPSKAPTMAMNR